ncbi:CarboxypepD_reg-like domain-containing protein [Salegentibacter echinorum]|uniref:CarboxypepD_reg-like domain-containing protein n=1 Tax=Salegentibacter echinorum TaxID=1073325 RepID=A0A1M5EP77_SALEC|nr:DUF5686 family protein [Salegentibacter echinorum]SHF80976.1 CarboxypepD_reg-like domain-containing protein [Salegentibacter echinorum]
MQRSLLLLSLLLSFFVCHSQQQINGKILDEKSGEPLAYAKIKFGGQQSLSRIDGSFSIELKEKQDSLNISYVGYIPRKIQITKGLSYLEVKLRPAIENLDPVVISSRKRKAKEIIAEAIKRKPQNDPKQKLKHFSFKNYTKFIVENGAEILSLESDSTNLGIKTVINSGATYFSEKHSQFYFSEKKGLKEKVEGLHTAGFKKPVYKTVSLTVNPFSLYAEDYEIFETDYAGPLDKTAFKNYSFKILDTTAGNHPAYVIYFKPKREKVVAGLEGVLYLDTTSYAIQRAKAQLLGAVKLEIDQEYKYFASEDLWFPKKQTTTIRPGNREKAISVFGGVISTGTVQKKKSLLNMVISPGKINPKIYLTSTSTNFEINLHNKNEIQTSAKIFVSPAALNRDEKFWNNNRTEPLSIKNKLTRERAKRVISEKDIEEKIAFKNSISTGYYPVGFWDFKLGKFFKFNNYEGIRLGFGGKTNEKVSKKFSLNGYLVYGTKDEVFKYNIGTAIHLDQKTETDLKLNYTRDIVETGSYEYLTGENEFSIIEPRFVNINFFYNRRALSAGITHRFATNLKTELRLSHDRISQIKDYQFLLNDREYSNYTLAEATLSFNWRPFAKYMETPGSIEMIEKGYPKFTGQISKGISGIFDGDFNYTKFGLMVEHEIKRINQSRTEFILEGNYAIGEVPLTHLYHALPNSPRRKGILRRYSVAGRRSFETMFYNEFFSDKQLMLHIKHQFRAFNLHPLVQPELVLITRHAIGDIANPQRHSIPFKSLKKGYHEAGVELQKILLGFGLGAAYRYGPYSLPDFDDNFAFKFTFHLDL